ncbi:MAG: magnesium transporter [Gammaproteobacteria bacterium]|jgi:magnesium transporter|nr:magnesium transporter [Gammaproteobacteria bacterium]
MEANPDRVVDALNSHFFIKYPLETAREIETMDDATVITASSSIPAKALAPVWQRLLPNRAATLLERMPAAVVKQVLEELSPQHAVRILGHMDAVAAAAYLDQLEPVIRNELNVLMSYPANTAGRLMDVSIPSYRRTMTAAATLEQLRGGRMKTARSLFLVDDNFVLKGKVALQSLALATPDTTLGELEEPINAVLRPIDLLEEITRTFETSKALDIPVIDIDGKFLGALTHDSIAKTVHQQSSLDMQTMVGASRDERALSSPFFTVKKRMPWLQINLLTAFMAAAVVSVFENTIAQVTALAVLLPVVAGQSGNAGAQALAVTMRGLALREITIKQWFRVMRKEVMAGFLNGLAIATTCGIGVYVWSGSMALVGVIAVSMVMAMVAAGFAGALIPIALTRLGQDPATSSSILLTTVTDIAGFFSFLGIATIFMRFL